jgi:hypothetical protein
MSVLSKKLPPGHGKYRECYKVLMHDPDQDKWDADEDEPPTFTLRSPYHGSFHWTPGVLTAKSIVSATGVHDYRYNEHVVCGGAIHVITTEAGRKDCLLTLRADCLDDQYFIHIKVRCRKEDFIAEGKGDQAAYTKVELLPEEYKAAKKRIRDQIYRRNVREAKRAEVFEKEFGARIKQGTK